MARMAPQARERALGGPDVSADDIPPWERPDARAARILAQWEEEARVRREMDEAILNTTLSVSEHLPEYDIEDACSGTTLVLEGCSCGVSTVHDLVSWEQHVDEVQRRDRAKVWSEAIDYADEGGEGHGMPWKNPYTKKED